jgi:hypothetical protein
MTNITIANNKVEGRPLVTVRLRMYDVNIHNGDKQPTDIVFDIPPGEEHRVNLNSLGTGFEIRPIAEGASFASDEKVAPDIFGVIDAYKALKKAILAVPAIRNDMSLSQIDRDAKAGAAMAEVMRLARQ